MAHSRALSPVRWPCLSGAALRTVKDMQHSPARALLAVAAMAPLALLWLTAGGCREQAEEPVAAPHEEEEVAEGPSAALDALERGEQVTLAQFRELLASPSGHERADALSRLWQVEDSDRAVQLALELLEGDPDYDVQVQAAMQLGTALRDEVGPDATSALLRAAQHGPGPVRAAAVQALKWGKGQAVEAVLQRLRSRQNPLDLRMEALRSLLALYAGQGPAGWRKMARFLGQREDDQSALAAIQFTVTGRRTVPVLIEVVETSPDPRQRQAAATVLATICAGRTETSEEFGKRARYVAGAPEREEPPDLRAVEPLIGALKDPYYPVREAAALGLGLLGDQRAVEPLGKALDDPAMPVRRRAASALVLLPAEPVIPALARRVRDDGESAAVRQFAVLALGWTKDAAAVDPLIDALDDSDPDVRTAAADFLGDLGDQRAVEPLTEAFDDQEVDVRWAAVRSAGKLGGAHAQRKLLDVYNDSHQPAMVVQAADDALRRMGHLVTYREADEEKLLE